MHRVKLKPKLYLEAEQVNILTDLFRSPGDENTKGLAEEAGQERVERWRPLQKCVHLVQQSGVR